MPSDDRAGRRARAAAIELREVEATSPEALAALRHYLTELDSRFEQGFDVEAAVDEVVRRDGRRGFFLVGASDDEPVACGGVRDLGPGIGEVKRMWVHRDWRGCGLGGRLLRALEERAAARGHRLLRLDTNHRLTEALALYARSGYREIARYNDNPDAQAWFEKTL